MVGPLKQDVKTAVILGKPQKPRNRLNPPTCDYYLDISGKLVLLPYPHAMKLLLQML